jgi:hypothetical protein
MTAATAASSTSDDFIPVAAKIYSDRQRLFLLYFVGALVDLVVLGLFDEYSDKVYVNSFTTMVLAAVVLQFLLKGTIAVEHWVASHFKGKSGGWWKALRFFCAWLVLFGSKFVILEALDITFGDRVAFEGVLHGIVWLIIVVVTMVIVEELIVRFYRKLA